MKSIVIKILFILVLIIMGIFQFEKEENTNPIGNGKGTIL